LLINPVKGSAKSSNTMQCGVWCCDFAQGNKNLERDKTQNNEITEFYPLLGVACVVVGSSF